MDYKGLLQQANDALARVNASKVVQAQEDRKQMMAMFGQDIVEALKPAIMALVTNSTFSKDELLAAISLIKINIPPIEVPRSEVDVKVADIPTPIVNVTVPEIKIPEIVIPAMNMKETNSMLKSMLEELKKEEKVSVNLKIV